MRTIKKPEERKNEILDAANELFERKGFDGTSTNDLLEAVGIARGTLYYHFKSKEDIMDALIERFETRALAAASEIAKNTSMPVTERIIKVVLSLKATDEHTHEMMEHLHRPQNALMHQKIQQAVMGGITPILAGLIREGIEQGLFETPFPYECMEMIIVYTNTVFDENNTVKTTETDFATRVQALALNLERMLGAKPGSLTDVVESIFSS